MNNKIRLSLLLVIIALQLQAQTYTPTAGNLQARSAYQDAKFGMFIHWGAFSVLGDGEWAMQVKNIPVKDYSKLQQIFNPTAFDAKKWVAAAKSAGMNYITFITRHHDGFSNWDTKQSDWKITNTPYGKDVLKQLADECHQQGIKLFCYYSLLDWYRSDYQYETGNTGQGTGRTEKSNWDSYIRFMKAQLTEILTNYGKIDGMWFDGFWDEIDNKTHQSKVDWHIDEIYKLIHSIQPDCLINNNHHDTPLPGEDIQSFEKDLPGNNTTGFGLATVSALPLETCETMNNSWGFSIKDEQYKTTKTLVQYLVKSAGSNANFLLNVGPMGNGVIQQEFLDTLKEIGKWTSKNGASIYGTRGGLIAPQSWGVITQKDKTLYVHILNKPQSSNYILIPGLTNKIAKASLFNDNKEIKYKQQAEGSFIYLDGIALDDVDTIIQIELK